MSSTFADLGVSEAVARALSKRGIETPFAVQSMVVPDVLDGYDVLVKSPTGSGKTLAFGVPLADIVQRDGAWPSRVPSRRTSRCIDESCLPSSYPCSLPCSRQGKRPHSRPSAAVSCASPSARRPGSIRTSRSASSRTRT